MSFTVYMASCHQVVQVNLTHVAHSGHCFSWTGWAKPGCCVCQSAAVS